jgi:hydrogenase maturation protein HypF
VAEIDLPPLLREAVAELLAGAPAGRISGRFHETLACAAAALVRRAAAQRGERLPVALTGGCFQNALLAERVSARIGSQRRVLRHRTVPPGDGGLALGQAVVAAAQLSATSQEAAACA